MFEFNGKKYNSEQFDAINFAIQKGLTDKQVILIANPEFSKDNMLLAIELFESVTKIENIEIVFEEDFLRVFGDREEIIKELIMLFDSNELNAEECEYFKQMLLATQIDLDELKIATNISIKDREVIKLIKEYRIENLPEERFISVLYTLYKIKESGLIKFLLHSFWDAEDILESIAYIEKGYNIQDIKILQKNEWYFRYADAINKINEINFIDNNLSLEENLKKQAIEIRELKIEIEVLKKEIISS
ncbi:hypothetical protein [Williamsoniiplasma luminosum]|uniref:Uncharacterized protein n=1 Tax=Williamsoniiplasma luminosum TaxID=214888 RepID=A0A2S0NJJ4_9MOLU|nr:hypothetical protein [Williamsoniiplasma luminosum]AVP49193.1 MAG: hypothetical protein C5T88_01165 [Williamsoniiplasma luminosum]